MRTPPKTDLLLAGVVAFLFFFQLGGVGLVETTDARYIEMSHEMLKSGDWLVPTLNGIRHLHKPPFVYWMGALGMRLFGVNEFGGRFFLALFALLTTLVVHRFLRKLSGPAEARLATLACATLPLLLIGARGMNTDVFLLLFETLALTGYWLHLRDGGRRDLAAFWFGLALTMFVKGPVGVLTVMLVILADRLLPGERLPWRPLRSAGGILFFLAVNLPWYLYIMRRLPGVLHYLVFEQLASRVGGAGLGHPRPVLYYLVLFPLATLPWSLFLPAALRGFRGKPLARFLVAWAFVPPLLFSIPKTKLPLYVLPALPAVAMLAGLHLAGVLRRERPWPRWPAALLTTLPAFAALGAFYLASRPGSDAPLRQACLVLLVLAAIGLADMVHAVTTRRVVPLALSAALFVALLHTGFFLETGAFEATLFRSTKPFNERIRAECPGGDYQLFQYQLFFPSMSFYLGKPVYHIDFERETRFEELPTDRLTTKADLPKRLAGLTGRAFLVTRKDALGDLKGITATVLLEVPPYVLAEIQAPAPGGGTDGREPVTTAP